jgi:hypothetical protein
MQDSTWFDKAKENPVWQKEGVVHGVVGAIGNLFLLMGNKMKFGTGVRSGDFQAMLLPTEAPAELRHNQLIRVTSSDNLQIAWDYICPKGHLNRIPVLYWDRKFPCLVCKLEFSVKAVIESLIRQARAGANHTRTANIAVERPITSAEFDVAIASLPDICPSQVSAPGNERFKDSWDPKNGASTGDTEYNGSNPGVESMESLSFGDPHSMKKFGR